jgi:DNA-binding NtrC family response regulator
VAPTEATAFLIGESGTGKELAAETLHRLSKRRKGPYLPLNCGAVSPTLIESEIFGHEKGSFTGAQRQHRGYFERASGGTLFLDEITEMPIELQVKLLRVLETGRIMRVGGDREVEVNVRVIAATNRNPEDAVKDGKLREDLFYRLKVFPITLPPLRDREGDIETLAQYFLHNLNKREGTAKRFSVDTMERLRTHHWPGNVRELQNVVQRAFILGDQEITPDCLPAELGGETQLAGPNLHLKVGTSLEDAERRLILATLDQYEGDKKVTAEVLGISLKTLYNRLNQYAQV